MKFYVLRHGKTYSNGRNLIQGQNDDDLNSEGIGQCKMLMNELKKKKISLILSSDLTRAKHTTMIILDNFHAKTKYWKILREKNNGTFTGLRSSKLRWKKLAGTYENRRPPGGESLKELNGRVKKFISLLKKNQNGERILVVTHGTFIKILKGHLEKKSIEDSIETIKINNCELLELEC